MHSKQLTTRMDWFKAAEKIFATTTENLLDLVERVQLIEEIKKTNFSICNSKSVCMAKEDVITYFEDLKQDYMS